VLDVVSHLADEPVPTLADPFPNDGDPLPGAYELHLPADGVTIWYVLFVHQGVERVSIQAVHED
jgi:hypothetical protein